MFRLDVEVIDPPLPERCRLECAWLSPAAPRFVFFFLCCVSYPLRVQLGGSVTEIPPIPPGTPSASPRLPSGIPHPVVGHASVGVWAELPATPSYSCTYPPLDAVPLDVVVTRVTPRPSSSLHSSPFCLCCFVSFSVFSRRSFIFSYICVLFRSLSSLLSFRVMCVLCFFTPLLYFSYIWGFSFFLCPISFFYLSCHTTHTTTAERRAEKPCRR